MDVYRHRVRFSADVTYDCGHVSTPHQQILHVITRLYEEKSYLVVRLDAIHARIKSSASLIERVRLKIEWIEERDKVVERLTQMVSSLTFINDGGGEIIDVEPTEIERLNTQLYAITSANLIGGYIRETSFSENGHSEWFTSMDSIPVGLVVVVE